MTTRMRNSDEQTIGASQSRNGNHAADIALISPHQPMILSLTFRMPGSVTNGRNPAQETGIRPHQQMDSFNTTLNCSLGYIASPLMPTSAGSGGKPNARAGVTVGAKTSSPKTPERTMAKGWTV